MLKNIQIQNFRCFENFESNGFERINLIGGKNNSGKTCFLEAIACLSNKFPAHQIVQMRDVSLNLDCIINSNSKGDHLTISSTNETINYLFKAKIDNGKKIEGIISIASLDISYINQKTELPALNILGSFDEFDAKLIKKKLIKILQVVDSRIEDMRTFSTKAGLYIKLENSTYEPLSNFGDAVKNLIRYFTPIFEKELFKNSQTLSILLIDEIENGIHYTAHYDFWRNIFKLSKELNVQIFATTHSLEMIQQFNKVALGEGDAAYFEMGREFETGKIFAQKHDIELLEYELEKSTSTVRG